MKIDIRTGAAKFYYSNPSFLNDIPIVKAVGIRAENTVMGLVGLPNYFAMKL